MKRSCRSLVLLLLALALAGSWASAQDKVPLVRPESPPLIQVTNNVFDLSDDLGCVWWSGVTNTGKGGRTATQIFGNSADGKFNSNLINNALNQGKSIGDKYGRYFPVAASSEAQPYAIRIPSTGVRYGGTIQGTGFIKRGWIPSGHSNAGTTFVCTTDPSVVPYHKQGVIGYRGVGWRIGPINIIGRYIKPGMGIPDLVLNGQVARYGLHCIGAPSGNLVGAIACFYLQEGITSDRDSNNTWYQLQFAGVKDCVVSNDLQTVNTRVMKVTIDDWCGTVFKFPHGGTLQCDQVVWNKPATLLEIGAAPWGHNSYTFDNIWTDSQLVRTTSTNPDTRLTDLLGRPAKFLRRSDGQNTGALILRINNGMIATNATAWFRNHRFFDQLRGYRNDVVINLPGLPADEAAAFAPKPSPQVYPADFAPPDSAKGESFTAPAPSKVVAWWDMSQDAKLNGGKFVDGDPIATLGTRAGQSWDLTSSSPAPTILQDGLHHRRAANIGASGRYLQKLLDGSNPLRNKDQIEVHLVAAMENPSGDNIERALMTVWKDGARTFEIGMIRATGSADDRKVFARISFDGAASGENVVTVKSESPLGWDTLALITLRYNGTGSRLAELDPGEVELVVNGESKKGLRIGGGNYFPPPNNVPLRIGACTNSSNGASQGMRGRVAEVVVQNQLSTFTLGDDGPTGATANSGELQEWRSYFRKKYGVW